MKNLRAAGTYIVGFGPRGLPALAAYAPLCDVWFDTGLGADDRAWERAHQHYLEECSDFSDIQDQSPRSLLELES